MKLATSWTRRSGLNRFVVDQPVGATDRRHDVDGDQLRHRAGDESVQDADAGAGTHRLGLAERRGDGEAGAPVGAELGRIVERGADDEVRHVADQRMPAKLGSCLRQAVRFGISAGGKQAERIVDQLAATSRLRSAARR